MKDFKDQLAEARAHAAYNNRIVLLLREIVDLQARLRDMGSENESLHEELVGYKVANVPTL